MVQRRNDGHGASNRPRPELSEFAPWLKVNYGISARLDSKVQALPMEAYTIGKEIVATCSIDGFIEVHPQHLENAKEPGFECQYSDVGAFNRPAPIVKCNQITSGQSHPHPFRQWYRLKRGAF